ncbi:hypothetical protein ACFQ12_10175 [Methylobacterium trifolii]
MTTDLQRLLDNAVAFHEAGARCYREGALKDSLTRTDLFLGAPSVVCYAFAIELYLKLLALITNGTYDKRQHKLDLLFAQLDPPLWAMIERHYSGGWPLRDLDVGSELHDASKAFVEWRYIHEHDSRAISPKTLAAIGSALHKTVKDVAPNLVSVFEAEQTKA